MDNSTRGNSAYVLLRKLHHRLKWFCYVSAGNIYARFLQKQKSRIQDWNHTHCHQYRHWSLRKYQSLVTSFRSNSRIFVRNNSEKVKYKNDYSLVDQD